MTITGQKKLSVYDPATGTVVQLNNISEDGEFEKKGSYVITSAGNRFYAGDESRAEFLSLDWSGYDQLVEWMTKRTPVRFVTYGLDEHIVWHEDTYMTVDQKSVFTPYKRSGFKIYFEKAGGVHDINKGANILFASLGWQDADNDEIADGYIIENEATYNFDAGNSKQDIFGVVTNLNFRGVIIYPISGIKLYLRNNFSAKQATSGKLKFIIRDFSNSILTNISNEDYQAEFSVLTPSNTYKIEPYPLNTLVIDAGKAVELTGPVLSSNSKNGIINY